MLNLFCYWIWFQHILVPFRMAIVKTLRAGVTCLAKKKGFLGASNQVQQTLRGYRDTRDNKVVVVTGASR